MPCPRSSPALNCMSNATVRTKPESRNRRRYHRAGRLYGRRRVHRHQAADTCLAPRRHGIDRRSPVSAAAVFTTNQTQAAPVWFHARTSRPQAAEPGPSSVTADAPTRAQVMRGWTSHVRRSRSSPARLMPSRGGARRVDRRYRRRSWPSEGAGRVTRRSRRSAGMRIAMRCSRS